MNVLLIIPQFKFEYNGRKKANYFFPLGIAYISSYLKEKKHNIYTYNGALFTKEESRNIIRNLIIEYQIDIVGIGGLSAEFSDILFYANMVKIIKSSILLVLGGGFITASPKVAMELVPVADVGIVGQGEIIFEKIINCYDKGLKLASLDNIVYRNELGEIIENQYIYLDIDLDDLPFPDYDGFCFDKLIDLNEKIIGERVAAVIASRSCPFSCTFCFHPSGERYRKRSVDNVVAEIDWLIDSYGINKVSLIDELFVDDRVNLVEFAKNMKKRGIQWECCARVDSIDTDILDILKGGNCKRISYGLESADDSVLKSMNKHIDSKMITQALSLTRNAGIEAVGAFIFGDIIEDKETAKNSLEYYLSNQEFSIDLNMLRVFPGSKDYKYAVENRIIENELDYIKKGCPLVNISKLDDEEYLELKIFLDEAISKKKRMPLNISFVKNNEEYLCHYTCPRCGEDNVIVASRLSDVFEGFCHSCSEYFHFSFFDCYEEELIRYFLNLENEKKDIILFPINNISIKIYNIYYQYRELKFFDSRYKNTKFEMVEDECIDKNTMVVNCSIGKRIISSDNIMFIEDLAERLMELQLCVQI